MSAVFSKSSRNHPSCVSKRPILSDFVQCRLCICQNWPAGPLPYRISLEMKWLFPKSFRWKTISSVHTIYDLTDLTGEFSLRAKLSLRRLWSGRSVLTNGKHSLPQTLPFALSKQFAIGFTLSQPVYSRPIPSRKNSLSQLFFLTVSVRVSVLTRKVLRFKIVLDRLFYFQRQKIFSRG